MNGDTAPADKPAYSALMKAAYTALMKAAYCALKAPHSALKLPLPTTQKTTFWTRIKQMLEEDVTVTVIVESGNKGGLLVRYGDENGFVPLSQFGPVGG